MNTNLRAQFCLCFALFGSMALPVFAADPEQRARDLIGTERIDVLLDEVLPGTECVNLGGGVIDIDGQEKSDWALDHASCGNRTMALLKRDVGTEGRYVRWRIVDTYLAPPIKKGTRLYQQGDCELDGKIDTTFYALARMGKRQAVNHRTGVLAAWTVDLEAQKIVPVSTRRVVCYRPTPP